MAKDRVTSGHDRVGEVWSRGQRSNPIVAVVVRSTRYDFNVCHEVVYLRGEDDLMTSFRGRWWENGTVAWENYPDRERVA